MGAQGSKNPTGVGYFTAQEIAELKARFNAISRLEKPGICSIQDFQNHCTKFMDDQLVAKLAKRFPVHGQQQQQAQVISIPEFSKFLSNVLRGTVEEKVECLVQLAAPGQQSSQLSAGQLVEYSKLIIKSFLKLHETSRSFQSWNGCPQISSDSVSKLSDFLLLEVLHKGCNPKDVLSKAHNPDSSFDVHELTQGFSRAPLLLNMQANIFSECFSLDKHLHDSCVIPACVHVKRAFTPQEFTMLDMTGILFINSLLPTECQNKWRYLFSTAADGESFAKLLGAIQEQGSTVIVVKETGGRVFGAFADASWALGPKFKGSEKCLLFHLNPKYLCYQSTGFNDNFQYLNIQQQTLPNGLGVGGKLDYFGLWLDAEFGKGKCAPSCTTFACPQLSTKEDFNIEAIEVWGVGPPPEKEENVRDAKSVLDKDPEARAILDLLNKPAASDGYREKKKAFQETEDDDD